MTAVVNALLLTVRVEPEANLLLHGHFLTSLGALRDFKHVQEVELQIIDSLLDALYNPFAQHHPAEFLSEDWLSMNHTIHIEIDVRVLDKILIYHAQRLVKLVRGVQMSQVEFQSKQTLGLEVLLNLEDALLAGALLRVDRQNQGLGLQICLQLVL